MTRINQSRPSIHFENLKSYNRVVECPFTERLIGLLYSSTCIMFYFEHLGRVRVIGALDQRSEVIKLLIPSVSYKYTHPHASHHSRALRITASKYLLF